MPLLPPSTNADDQVFLALSLRPRPT